MRRSAAALEETYKGYSRSRRKQKSWSASNPGNMAIRAEFLEAILELAAEPLAGNGRILDVGCGGGWLLSELRRHGVAAERLHGIDLISDRVDAARSRVLGADLRSADARALPFDDGGFELVLLLTTLSSMPADGVVPALREARRVASPHGTVLVYEPRLASPFNRNTVTISRRVLAEELGSPLADIRLTGFPPLARRLGRLAPQLYPLLSRVAPTHRVTVHESGAAQAPRE